MKPFAFTDVLDPNDNKPIRVLARISVLGTEDGGPFAPRVPKYRPNHNFGAEDNTAFYIGQIEIPVGSQLLPGQTRDLEVIFLPGPGLKELIHVGRRWRIQEGLKLIATADVIAVLTEA